VYKDE